MKLFEKYMKIRLRKKFGSPILANQNGSTVVIALLILVVLTLGGITATTRSVNESWTVRNTAIYKQNLNLAEAAAHEGAREILNRLRQDIDINPGSESWIINFVDWDPDFDHPAPEDRQIAQSGAQQAGSVLRQRGEAELTGGMVDDSTLTYYIVLDPETLTGGYAKWRGHAVGVYESDGNFGRRVVEIGFEIEF